MNTHKRSPAILLIGPTGAGKTPLGMTAEAVGLHGIPCRHFDFGAQLRATHKQPKAGMTPQARHIIQEVLEKGRLLETQEDFVAMEILQCWQADSLIDSLTILNGLPRTIAQANRLETIVDMQCVVQLEASDETIFARITQNSGGDRTGRIDDQPDAIQKRLLAYRAQTAPLINYYREKGVKIITFPITPSTRPQEIWETVQNTIPDFLPPPNYISALQAARILQDGGVVAVPTETVYGLAADALDSTAVARIFTIKQRPANDPLIVHIHHQDQIKQLATTWPEAAAQLARAFWPGPLTMILSKQAAVPDLVTAQLPTVAIRMPAHPVMRQILSLCKCPLAAPSANRFGCISPTTAQHVADSLGREPDGIVDGGPCHIGLESTIVGFGQNQILIMRPGAITAAEIAEITGMTVLPFNPATQHDIPAPGTMPRHYAPKTPMAMSGTPDENKITGNRIGLLRFGTNISHTGPYEAEINLSPKGDLHEAANRLYDAIRQLDQLGLDGILAEPIPQQGIGTAINDRLQRACKAD